jgi:hypothetical protein
VDHEIQAFQELEVSLVAGMVKHGSGRIPEGFVIGNISDSGAIARYAICNSGGGMIQILSFDENIADPEEALLQFGVMNPAREVM